MISKPPPLLLGATLLFWGWHTEYLLAGLAMGALFEGARWIPTRWEFTDDDFRRVWNLCLFLAAAGLVYALTTNDGLTNMREMLGNASPSMRQNAAIKSARSGLLWFRWLPMTFFVMAAAQLFSHREALPGRLFWVLRRKLHSTDFAPALVHTGYPYFVLCLVSASITNRAGLSFYAGLCGLLGWALWNHRSPRYAPWVWAGAMGTAAGLGFFGQAALYQLEKYVDNFNADFLLRTRYGGYNLQEVRTSLGQLGRMKLSGQIRWWVQNLAEAAAPTLLHEASYRTYSATVWRNTALHEEYASYETTNESTWVLLPAKPTEGILRISGHLPGGHGLLPVPHGLDRLERLPVFTLKTNNLGMILVDAGPGVVSFDARWGPGQTLDGPPGEEDLAIPEGEEAALGQVATNLHLAGLPPQDILQRVRSFFSEKFHYTLLLRIPAKDEAGPTPISRFLLETHAGHCEYFATATTLLLRKAGIPARYAVGYALQEKSGHTYVARERHAHAWCLAYLKGGWHDFDTTPGQSFAIEAARANWMENIQDAWARLWFEFSKWRWGQSSLRQYIGWIFTPILVLLVVQLFRRKGWRRSRLPQGADQATTVWPGLDSEFYRVEQRLIELGLGSNPGEPALAWLQRLDQEARLPGGRASLHPLLHLHYRYRFDPLGLPPEERSRLAQEAQQCLEHLERDGVNPSSKSPSFDV